MALVLDTGVVYGALDENDADHQRCRHLLEASSEALIVPDAVLVEVDYLLRKFAPTGLWQAFAEDVVAGAYEVFHLDPSALLDAARIQERYEDLRLGFVDAAVFVTCERLAEGKVATLDRRHFSVLKTADGVTLDLLPA